MVEDVRVILASLKLNIDVIQFELSVNNARSGRFRLEEDRHISSVKLAKFIRTSVNFQYC